LVREAYRDPGTIRPVADDKKTQLGTTSRSVRPTNSPPLAAATGTPAPVVPPQPVKQTSYMPEVPDPLLGTTVAGRYLIDRKLGEGGMGAVYLATHTLLEKQVALKVLHGEFARKPDLVERFMQEAKAASRIRHENVIDISDFGSTPEGLVFFAMELLTGHDLHDEVARARVAGELLPWTRSKKIFLQICSALSAAHARGIVHRDLKPENVFLVDFLGDPDFVKLLDFGIAKLTEVKDDGGRKLTKTGMLFGTPEYMSPEQARGEAVDHRVDVYAMGCILFQLVAGRVPFEADNFMGILSMHLTEEPPVIAPVVYDKIGAPRALAGVIDRALAKDRDARFQTIDELAAAVREVCGDPPLVERSKTQRAPSVPTPTTGTTRKREPTQPVKPVKKTEWTGKISVPEVEAEHATPVGTQQRPGGRSRVALAIGGALVVVVGGIVAYAVTRGGGDATPSTAATGSAVASGSPGSAQEAASPPPPPPPVALPEFAKLALDSTPHGATVTDLSTGKVLGKTPLQSSLAGSKTPRQFAFHLQGYADTTVELVPDHETITYSETLVRGANTGTAPVHVVADPAIHKPDTASPGAVTKPDVDTTVTRPQVEPGKPPDATKPDATKPDTTKPDTTKPDATKPDSKDIKPTTPAKSDECGDGSEPCLKRNIPGLGSGS
jgi:serine/threonine protein kinase